MYAGEMSTLGDASDFFGEFWRVVRTTCAELQMADADLPAGLRKFYRRYAIPATLLVKELKREQVKEGISVMEAEKFLKGLYL